MNEIKITINEIKELMDKMAQTGLGQLVLEQDDFKLKLCAQKEQIMLPAHLPMTTEVPPQIPAYDEIQIVPPSQPEEVVGNVVKSPIVGTFYTSPSPDKPAFAPVGASVHKGDVLFIIESMKLMNEVQSEFDGEIVKVLVEDGTPVEYDQPLMIIR